MAWPTIRHSGNWNSHLLTHCDCTTLKLNCRIGFHTLFTTDPLILDNFKQMVLIESDTLNIILILGKFLVLSTAWLMCKRIEHIIWPCISCCNYFLLHLLRVSQLKCVSEATALGRPNGELHRCSQTCQQSLRSCHVVNMPLVVVILAIAVQADRLTACCSEVRGHICT